MLLIEHYNKNVNTESDIQYHLPVVKALSDLSTVVCELGVRAGISFSAMLASEASVVIGIDLERYPQANELLTQAEAESRPVEYHQQDSRDGIPFSFNVDFLHIDTRHDRDQCESELMLYTNRTKKFIAFHDTATFWKKGETTEYGIQHAITGWKNLFGWWLVYQTYDNNGFMVFQNPRYEPLSFTDNREQFIENLKTENMILLDK